MAVNNYIIKIITIVLFQMIPVSYTMNRLKINYQRISLLRFILNYPPYIHNIHSSNRKNDDIETFLTL